MELIKPHHTLSLPVKRSNLSFAGGVASEMVEFLDNGNKVGFEGNWRQAVALSHCQVSEAPLRLFVVSDEMLRTKEVKLDRFKNRKNFYFPSRAIFNAEILEAKEKITRKVPTKKVERNGKQVEIKLVSEEKQISNMIEAPDGCMSYPNRTKKNTKRYHTIKVRYQVLRTVFGVKYLKTVTEVINGFKAHVFQHELDHAYGIDIVYGNGQDRNPPKPYATQL